MDFYTPYYLDNEKYKEEIERLGGKIYWSNGKFYDNKGDKKDFKKNLNNFLKENQNKYDVFHIHSGSIFSLAVGARLAKKSGIKRVIVHSHSAGFKNLKHSLSKFLFRFYFKKYPTDLWACSKVAAYWKFPKRLFDKKGKIIKNTINVNNYIFNSSMRNTIRKKYGIKDKDFVVGTVGRLSIEKNQLFLLDVFKKIKEINKNSFLLIVGDGPLMDTIKNTIDDKHINNVLLLGNQRNINEILNSFDVFVLPSIYEGLPMTVIESQANNLPCALSKNITEECKINDNVSFISLDDSYEEWANEIIELNKKNADRSNQTDKMLQYDTKNYVKELEKEYLSY